MKKILGLLLVAGFVSAAFAHPGHPHKRKAHRKGKKAVVVVRGEKAKAIYEALNAEATTVTIRNKKFDKKSVSSLKCLQKLDQKAKGPKFRCVLKGKKPGKGVRRGNRGHHRRGHGRRGHGRRGHRA